VQGAFAAGHAGVCTHVRVIVVIPMSANMQNLQPAGAMAAKAQVSSQREALKSVWRGAFPPLTTFSSSLQVKVTILLPVGPIAHHHHGGHAQHDETACNDPSKLDKTKTPMLDGSARRDPPPDSRGHDAAETSRLGFIRGRLQRMAVCYREGKLPPTKAARTLSGRVRTHCPPATTPRPPYLARYRTAVLHVPILPVVRVRVVDAAKLVPRQQRHMEVVFHPQRLDVSEARRPGVGAQRTFT
jgi:hypothetical protein